MHQEFEPKSIGEVFRTRHGNERVTRISQDCQSVWHRDPDKPERTELFASIKTGKCYATREEVRSLTAEDRRSKRASKEARRIQRRMDRMQGEQPLPRILRTA